MRITKKFLPQNEERWCDSYLNSYLIIKRRKMMFDKWRNQQNLVEMIVPEIF